MSNAAPQPTSRRDFLNTLALSGAVLGVAAACAPSMAQSGAAAAPAPGAGDATKPTIKPPPAKSDGPFDNAWLDHLTAKHKQVFDCGSYSDGGMLYYANNYLNAHRDAYDMAYPDVQIVMGMHGDAWPIVLNDAMWEKYKLGEKKKTKDPRTKELATRNVFWQTREGEPGHEFSVNALQARGATFILCNNVLRFVVTGIAQKNGESYETVRKELTSNMLPGVTVVPAMVAAIGLAQHKGCSYIYAGG
ncbi:MAG: hypothetical protein M3081_14580 [Gemmatimonadota bacterium]|nr:hypothetical protein [Gemmatimonadota bacterium]